MQNKDNKNKKWLWFLVAGSLIVKLSYFIYGRKRKTGKLKIIRKNFKNFAERERREIKELESGEETFGKYCTRSISIFKNYFIPNECNGHKPKILHTNSLIVIVAALMIVKISITGYLFFMYPDKAEMETQITSDILTLINADRQKNNLEPLTMNTVLSASALSKADNMVMQNYFAHYGPDGKKPWDWINRNNYQYLFVGENLAMNFTNARSVHQALMDSPTHKKNILNDRYEDIGLAVVSGEINGQQTNILVELFASKKKPSLVLETASDNTAGTTKENVAVTKTQATKVLSANNTKAKENSVPVVKPKITENDNVKNDIKNDIKNTNAVTQTTASTEIAKTSSAPAATTTIIATTTDISAATATPQVNIAENISTGTVAALTEVLAQKNEEEKQAFVAELAYKADNFISPNPDLESGMVGTVEYSTPKSEDATTIDNLLKYSKYLYFGVLLFVVTVLLINIFVRITIQHKPVIIEALIVLVFISSLIVIKLHFLEYIVDKIAII